ncbi:MAG TPA: ATP-binding cassette domain-containing protein [Thermomicrobiales bacterium]|nr:ATP-binding cassette domain-containing protein [Thermomicrobiales bacterium]
MTKASAGSAILERVSFQYPNTASPALREESWEIHPGAFALVVGPSGCGKSTLLRSLNGLVPHFSGGSFGGRVLTSGQDTRGHGPRELARSVGFVFQDPEAQLVTDRVDSEIAFGLEQQGIQPLTMRQRVEEVLDLLGIAHLRHRNPQELSGGERQRVAIAATLALHPSMLVLDEPTSQLDPWGAGDVFNALTQLNDELGLTVVIAEHRLERFLPHADVLFSMPGKGLPSCQGQVQDVIPSLADVQLPPIVRLGRFAGIEPLPLNIKQARQSGLPHLVPPYALPPLGTVPTAGSIVCEPRGVGLELGGRKVLHDVDLSLRAGELVALMGRNGSGKTSLLRTIAGLQAASTGSVVTVGLNMRAHGPADLKGSVGYLPQQASTLFFRDQVGQELTNGRRLDAEGQELLARFGLSDKATSHPLDLSGGERERAALATVLAQHPRLVLLDEPTRGMDAWRKAALAGHLRELAANGTTVVLVTHDVELVADCAARVVMLAEGSVLSDGAVRDALGGSLTWSTQINKVFGGTWLTVDDIESAMSPGASPHRPPRPGASP